MALKKFVAASHSLHQKAIKYFSFLSEVGPWSVECRTAVGEPAGLEVGDADAALLSGTR